MLPEGCLRDILQGQESEIRQRAVLLLLERFLRGNHLLTKATENNDLTQVANQIQRSINAALRLSKSKVQSSILRDRRRFIEFDERVHSSQDLHPSCREKVSELPLETQRSLLLLLLEEGVRERSISEANSTMVHQMMEQGMSQSEMAEEMGISRQAVNQRIRCVADVVQEELEKREFPSSTQEEPKEADSK